MRMSTNVSRSDSELIMFKLSTMKTSSVSNSLQNMRKTNFVYYQDEDDDKCAKTQKKLPKWLVEFQSVTNGHETHEPTRPLTEQSIRPLWFEELVSKRRHSDELNQDDVNNCKQLTTSISSPEVIECNRKWSDSGCDNSEKTVSSSSASDEVIETRLEN